MTNHRKSPARTPASRQNAHAGYLVLLDAPAGSPAPRISRRRIEAAIQALIDLLDEADAPAEDMEPDDDDCCSASDDDPVSSQGYGMRDVTSGIGDPLDGELETDEAPMQYAVTPDGEARNLYSAVQAGERSCR